MPIFEYKCADCGAKFDELVGSPDEEVPCPKCKSEKTEKQLSVFAASVSSGSGNLPSMPSCARPGCGAGGFS